jgi:peptidoglycan/LPS O-acetylase OafA/YrhL
MTEPRPTIKPLTGIRIVAALWVVLFHLSGNIFYAYPEWEDWLAPIIRHGDLGVDLFFALSGYILSYNYAARMGGRLERRTAVAFWWARVARVWPVFALTLVWATAYHGYLLARGVTDPVAPKSFTVGSFLRQITLTALWTEPDLDRVMFNGPSWSVSAEAFAYLLFPVAVLAYARAGRALSRRVLVVLAVLAVTPISVVVLATDTLFPAWGWLLRIVCGFTSGALMYQAQRDLEPSDRLRRWASHAALALVGLFVAGLYVSWHTGHGHLAPIMAPVFVVLIGLFAVGDRHLARLLATRPFVTGGAASYSVYMVHMLIIEPVVGAEWEWGWLTPDTEPARVVWLVLPVVVSLAGYALWRWFEEPARRALRRARPLSS